MPIQWFPGHMTSARKKAAETMERIDVVIEVLDARLPEASSNPMIRALRLQRQRPCLKVLNKADVADPAVTRAWLDQYNRQPGVKAIAISSKKPGDVNRVTAQCQMLAPHRNDTLKPLRMMIMGIPNVGKSTLMNALLKRKVAAVGDMPAVTKSQQRLDLNSRMTLTDTPGMLWPKIEHDSDGYMLAASHAVGTNAVIEEEVGTFLAGILLERYPVVLKTRYRLDPEQLDAAGVLEAIGRQRGCVIRNGRHAGEPDLDKAAIILLTDYRQGALGPLSLESPQTRAAMLAADAASIDTAPGAAASAAGDGAEGTE
ncbi:MAG: ribosome biogenesis GTPase YlqF [Proteobacteria bacterium]|nr:ribosome biogenesis GTPase YlqF [Pseudomonadota bacterium]HQR04130.1 ribosome biogenesis GTPase YlqF [Rhodocyclaceae bacterium]